MDAAKGAEIGVFPEEAGVFFVDADGVFDVDRGAIAADVCSGLLDVAQNE